MTFQLGAKKKVKKSLIKDSVRTETNKKMEKCTNKTKIKNKEVPERWTIIRSLGEIGKREAINGAWTQKAEKIICVTSSMMTSLNPAKTGIVTEEMEEVNKEGAVEEIEGEVMEEEEDEVVHQCKKMEEGQVLVTIEAATSTIGETVATTKDLWIIITAHHIE